MNNGNQNPWQKVSDVSNNDRFEPHKNEGNSQYPKFLEGYYTKTREIAGLDNKYFKSHEIVTVAPDGTSKAYDVSGGVSLDKKLESTPLNSYIRIEYLGRVPSKHPGRNPFKNWEVYVNQNAVPFNQLNIKAAAAPVNTPPPAPPVQQTPPPAFGNPPAFGGSNSSAPPPFPPTGGNGGFTPPF